MHPSRLARRFAAGAAVALLTLGGLTGTAYAADAASDYPITAIETCGSTYLKISSTTDTAVKVIVRVNGVALPGRPDFQWTVDPSSVLKFDVPRGSAAQTVTVETATDHAVSGSRSRSGWRAAPSATSWPR